MTERIRWHQEAGRFVGHVGTLDPWAFMVWQSASDHDDVVLGEWVLSIQLPGSRRERLPHGTDPDELKAEAERWLEEFISSLGAIFPAKSAPRRRRCGSELDEDCPRPVAWLWWPDGRDGPGGSVYLCDEHAANIDLPELEDLADQTPAPRAAGTETTDA